MLTLDVYEVGGTKKLTFCSITTQVRLDFNVDFLLLDGDNPVCQEPPKKKQNGFESQLDRGMKFWVGAEAKLVL